MKAPVRPRGTCVHRVVRMRTALLGALALSAAAFRPAARASRARPRATVVGEGFGMPGAEDPNENTPRAILGEKRLKTEFIRSYAPDATLLKRGLGGVFAAASGSHLPTRTPRARRTRGRRARGSGDRARGRRARAGAGDGAGRPCDLFGAVDTPITVDEAAVDPGLLGAILSANVGVAAPRSRTKRSSPSRACSPPAGDAPAA